MLNSHHQYNRQWLIGMNNDVWTTISELVSHDADAINRGLYYRIPHFSDVKNIVSIIHPFSPILTLTNSGKLMSGLDVIANDVRAAFNIDIEDDDNENIIILYNSGEVFSANIVNGDLVNLKSIAVNIKNIYPMSIENHNAGVHVIDSFIMEESEIYTLTHYINGVAITSKTDIHSIVSVNGRVVLSQDSIHIFQGDNIGIYSIPDNVVDAVRMDNGIILYILSNGNLINQQHKVLGSGYKRFSFFEYIEGVVVVGNDEKTYRLNIDNVNQLSLEDLDIPFIIK